RGIENDAMISWVDLTPTILDFAGIEQVLAPPREAGDPETPTPPSTELVPYTFHGRSFLSVLEATDPEGWSEVYASHSFHSIVAYYPMRVVRTERYKLILNLAHQLPFPMSSDLVPSATWRSVNPDREGARFGKRL